MDILSSFYAMSGVLFIVLIFLALREVWCWYWKINERNEKLSIILDLLKDISEKLDPKESEWVCEKCNSSVSENDRFCPACGHNVNEKDDVVV